MTKHNPLMFLALSLLTIFSCAQEDKRLDSYYEGLPFEMSRIKAPKIPANTVTLTDFGAVGDGVTLNTEAFAKAFKRLEEMGGGRLVVPDGIWFTGPIGLRSHTELHLEDNAIIIFSTDQDL